MELSNKKRIPFRDEKFHMRTCVPSVELRPHTSSTELNGPLNQTEKIYKAIFVEKGYSQVLGINYTYPV